VETQQVVVRPDYTGSEKPQFDIDRGGLDANDHLNPYSSGAHLRHQGYCVTVSLFSRRSSSAASFSRHSREEHHSAS
jgi:hypothetical protein